MHYLGQSTFQIVMDPEFGHLEVGEHALELACLYGWLSGWGGLRYLGLGRFG